MHLAWIYLIVSGLLEIVWALGIRATEGFTKFWPSVYTLATMAVGIYLLSLAVRTLPIGTAYAVWTGIGAVGTALFGMLFFQESRDLLRIGAMLLIIIGIVGLRLAEAR
jgi:quaternary ammonium compound-resistance protein SugE